MVTTNLRFTNGSTLFEEIKKSARRNRRSMNAEILRAIEYYLENAPEAKSEKEVPKKKSKSP